MQKLQAHLQTRKISSLPEDLRNIAEELLIEKFGRDDVIEEVKAEKSADTFPGFNEYSVQGYSVGIDMGYEDSTEIAERFSGVADELSMGYGRMEHRPGLNTRVDFSSRQRVVTTPVTSPDFRGLTEALRRLDEQNLPRRDRIFRFNPRFWDAIYDRELSSYLATTDCREYSLLGCRILVEPSNCNELEVRF